MRLSRSFPFWDFKPEERKKKVPIMLLGFGLKTPHNHISKHRIKCPLSMVNCGLGYVGVLREPTS